MLVDEPPDRSSAQQFRHLVPKMGESRQVWKVLKRVLREKPLIGRDLVFGEVEKSEVC